MNSYTQRSIGADFAELSNIKREVATFFINLERFTAGKMGIASSEKIALQKINIMLRQLPPAEKEELMVIFYKKVLLKDIPKNSIVKYTEILHKKLYDVQIDEAIEAYEAEVIEAAETLAERQLEIASQIGRIDTNTDLLFSTYISFTLVVG